MDFAYHAMEDMIFKTEHAFTLLPTLPHPMMVDANNGKMKYALNAQITGFSM